MREGLTPGATASQQLTVDERLVVPAMPLPGVAEIPPVLATGYLVAFAEMTCDALLRPYLADGESTVGIEVCFEHTAATPIGMAVTADATLTALDGRIASFEVVLRDDVEQVGKGTHKRAVIDRARFDAKVAAKQD